MNCTGDIIIIVKFYFVFFFYCKRNAQYKIKRKHVTSPFMPTAYKSIHYIDKNIAILLVWKDDDLLLLTLNYFVTTKCCYTSNDSKRKIRLNTIHTSK